MLALSKQNCELTGFDVPLWIVMVQKATTYHDRQLAFSFQIETRIEA